MEDKFPFFTSPIVFPYYLVIWKSYGAKKVRSAGMDDLWNNDKKTSLLFLKKFYRKQTCQSYGKCMGNALP